MGSYDCTISIGHLGEQLTLNQWVLGSSPRWCTKRKPPRRIPPWGLCFWFVRSEGSNRATAPQCRNQQSCGLLVSPRESPREWKRSRDGAGVEVFPLHSLTENVGLFFCCYNPGCCDSLCSIGGREQLRRRPPPAAETGSRSRGRGRRGGVPPKGRRPMLAPQPVKARRFASRPVPTVQWTVGKGAGESPGSAEVGRAWRGLPTAYPAVGGAFGRTLARDI